MVPSQRVPALILKMKALRPSLSKSEQQVIDYICEHPEQVIYLSVADLAEKSGVSDATVVRACRSLGASGYQDLKVTLAQDIVTPLQAIHEEIDTNDKTPTIVEKVFQSAIHALTFTHDTLNIESLEKAAEAVLNARDIIIIGLGNSHAVAIDLQHKLLRLGFSATAHTDSHMQTIAIAHLKKGDLIFAISHSGSSRDIVENAHFAKENGATIISLTNIGTSPLSKLADISLYTASQETRYRIAAMSSRIAQMAIIDSLYTVIAVRKADSVEGFYKIEKALKTKKF